MVVPNPAPNVAPPLAAAKESDLRRTKKLRALLLSKYDSVLEQAEGLGWTTMYAETGEDEPTDYNICWSDTSVSNERVMKMGRMQKVNHFPGMRVRKWVAAPHPPHRGNQPVRRHHDEKSAAARHAVDSSECTQN
jgi:hypothetical protein